MQESNTHDEVPKSLLGPDGGVGRASAHHCLLLICTVPPHLARLSMLYFSSHVFCWSSSSSWLLFSFSFSFVDLSSFLWCLFFCCLLLFNCDLLVCFFILFYLCFSGLFWYLL
ncbi:hypothetical protein E2C01_091586 [Portunus trituberculatus]|uniref:Uncharacterized protein n=1 Tax=Portunus trituberculatus TaxID=210409 RepID=A0A5B7JJE9_PORTR|nr:hypothetical protein [Portunus trituberculatus]